MYYYNKILADTAKKTVWLLLSLFITSLHQYMLELSSPEVQKTAEHLKMTAELKALPHCQELLCHLRLL